jgi:hypothetical protein
VPRKRGLGVLTRGNVLAMTMCVLAGLAANAISQQPAPAPNLPPLTLSGAPQQVILRLGDSVVVDGAPIGCAVTNRSGRVVIECGRTSKVAGSYMSILSSRTLKVARMRSADVGKTILTATHGAGWRACGMSARAALSGESGCR